MKIFQPLILCLILVISCNKKDNDNVIDSKNEVLELYEKFKEINSALTLVDPTHKNNIDDDYPDWPEDLKTGHMFLMTDFSIIDHVFNTLKLASKVDTNNEGVTFKFESDGEGEAPSSAVFKISDHKSFYTLNVTFVAPNSDDENTITYNFYKNSELLTIVKTMVNEMDGEGVKLDTDLKWTVKDQNAISITQTTKMLGNNVSTVDITYDIKTKKGLYAYEDGLSKLDTNNKIAYLIDDEELTRQP